MLRKEKGCTVDFRCVSPKSMFGGPKTQCHGIWSWGLWEVTRLSLSHKGPHGTNALIKKDHNLCVCVCVSVSLCVPLFDSLCHVRTQQECSHLTPGEGLSLRT